MRNPFPYGRELDPGELVDRREELKAVQATIRNRDKLFLIGPRRYGKTSLLRSAEEQSRAAGVAVLRFDAEKYESLDLLAAAILTAATRAMAGPAERAARQLGRVAAALKPQVSLDATTGEITVSLGLAGGRKEEVARLADALDAVERMAEEADREMVLMLDEVQAVVIEHGLPAERQLRSTVQRHRRVAYIFAGSATRLLAEMTGDPNRPFFRLGGRLFLGEIPREDFLTHLVNVFSTTGVTARAGACDRILDAADDVPYNVQRLAHACWEWAIGEEAELTPEAVDASLERIVRREDPAYTQIWRSLTRNQKTALKAVIVQRGVDLLSAETARRHGLPTSSMQRALESLLELQLIRQDLRVGDVRYRLIDPFLATWIVVAQRV